MEHPPTYCPRLRPGLSFFSDHLEPHCVLIQDQLRIAAGLHRLSITEFGWLQLFDGRRSLHEIRQLAMQQQRGQDFPLERFVRLVAWLDELLFLDTPRFRERVRSPVREPSCIGCYDGTPEGLREQLDGLFRGPRGPGATPATDSPSGRLRAALIPHIDYQRGGHSFAWGFKEVAEHADANLFVIIGTSHYSRERFTLTRQDFRTPLGIARTDQDYIDRLVRHYGDGLFNDDLAHVPEHSIELEVVFLQYLYAGRRDFRIVPLVVGSFADCVADAALPTTRSDIAAMIEALRRTEAETPEPISYIISGDLAHIGPKFGDLQPLQPAQLEQSRQRDLAVVRHGETVNPAAYFQAIAQEQDARRICGLPPTYTVLEAIRPRAGKLLDYDQYVHPRGLESVSFASVAFYR